MPLFPLNLVAFPQESLNLHIFEPRYKQLVGDCLELKRNFAIPSFVNKRIEYGTEMKITDVNKIYDDGRMDITTRGVTVVKVNKFSNPAPGKLYAGGQIERMANIDDVAEDVRQEMIALLTTLYQTLNIVEEVNIAPDINSYDVGHKIGLTMEQEYQCLKIISEQERQLFIIAHLKRAIPILRNVEKMKEKIKMNGYFQHYDPLDF